MLGLSLAAATGIRKLILLGYANHADKHGRGAYPSTQSIAECAECDVRTMQRHVSWLIANRICTKATNGWWINSTRGTARPYTTSR